MESLDVINYFLHNKIAAKMWKRTVKYSRNGSICYIYTSVRDDTRKFKLVWIPSRDYVCICDYLDGHGRYVDLFSEDISRILSTQYSLIFYIGIQSSVSILYWNG